MSIGHYSNNTELGVKFLIMNKQDSAAAYLEQRMAADQQTVIQKQGKAIEWSIKFFGGLLVGSTVAIQLVLHPPAPAPQTAAERAESDRKDAIIQDFADYCQQGVTSRYQQDGCDAATSILYDVKNRHQ
jgi:hypothetical protein